MAQGPRWHSGGPVKLQRSLRGDGVLTLGERKLPVSYQIDLFRQGTRPLTASGVVEGDLGLEEDGEHAGLLRLAEGVELEVTLEAEDEDGAAVWVIDPLLLPQ
jgi:hypothetical protein